MIDICDACRKSYEMVDDIVMILNKNGEIEHLNQYGQNALKYREEKIKGINAFDSVFSANEYGYSEINDLTERISANHGKHFKCTMSCCCSDNTSLSCFWKIGLTIQPKTNEKVIICIGTIISEQTDIEKHQKLAIRSDRLRSLGEMASGMAHEFNQPLTVIRGAAENIIIGLERNWTISKEEMTSRLERVVEQTSRLSNLIEHMRNLAYSASESMDESFNINESVEGALKLITAQLTSREVNLTVNQSASNIIVRGNPFALEEVLLTLLSNARDSFDEDSGSNIDLKNKQIFITTRKERLNNCEKAVLEVSDTGSGIEETFRDRIFEPFFTTKGPDRGTGLGLASAKAIIEEMHGQCELVGESGNGSTFRITLPLAS